MLFILEVDGISPTNMECGLYPLKYMELDACEAVGLPFCMECGLYPLKGKSCEHVSFPFCKEWEFCLL